jgi:2-oxoisovalerate dehydrogenase E1 component
MSITRDRAAAVDSDVKSDSEPIDKATRLALYEQMMLIRRFELIAQDVYRKGEMPGFIHLYVGEEATAVGVCAHLRRDDWVTSTHRGHGHALAKGVSPGEVLAELYGRSGGCCGGRGGSMHLYKLDAGLFGTNGFVGGGLPATVGLGFAARTRGTDQVAVAFFGDGAVNHAAFHESINLAGVQKLPVVFVCENNNYATATPLTMATLNTEVATKAASYGIPGVAVDGNDVLAMWEVMRKATARARSGQGPTLIEAKTYRVVGHHEGDPLTGTYRNQEELDHWKARCPIATYRARLLEEGHATGAELDAIDQAVEARMADALAYARNSPHPDPATANDHVWADPLHPPVEPAPATAETRVQTWLEAVRDGIAEEMRRDPHIIYLGEGTGERGGSFAHTKGLWHEFGGERMIDTPISELGFTGAAAGASAAGCRAVADVMFADFMFEAASQIIEQAAKLRYMSNGQTSVPMIVRAAWGTIKNTGPHHSGSYHPIWAHCPGLIVVIPSSPADAKGLMKTALRSHDPVIFLEPKALFPTKGPVPVGEHLVPFGVASIVREGTDLTIVSCGSPIQRCLAAAEQLAAEGVSCEIVDLRTVVPLDVDTIVASVTKTRHLLVVDEGFSMCGLGAEVMAVVMEQAFAELDEPAGRLHTDPVGHPFSPAHENAVVVSPERIVSAARAVMAGQPELPRRLRASGKPQVGGTSHRASVASPAPAASAASTVDGVALVMPNVDLTVNEARVIQWLKKVGQRVAQGEAVVEVETDKAVMNVESPADGTLVEIAAPPDTVVLLGQRLGTVRPS